jgi:hypothetical protein
MIEKIENLICIGENVDPIEIHEKSRNGKLKEARQIIMYFARRTTNKTFAQIGSYFDLDHATVTYACKAVKDHIETNRLFREKMAIYENRVNIIKLDNVINYGSENFKSLEYEVMKFEKKLIDIQKYIDEIKTEMESIKSVEKTIKS